MEHERHTWMTWFAHHHYGLLLASLLLYYAIHPFLGTHLVSVALLVAALLLIVTALLAVRDRKVLFWLGIVLGATAYTLQIAKRFGDIRIASADLVEVLFLAILIVAITGGVMRMPRVTMNAVFGACSIYLLLVLAWSDVYEVLEATEPGSFKHPEIAAGAQRGEAVESELLYFSMITMTTVGYGDITPVSPPARSLSALQGLIGQLFLAIVVARIVSMEIGERMARRGNSDRTGGT